MAARRRRVVSTDNELRHGDNNWQPIKSQTDENTVANGHPLQVGDVI